MELRILLLMDEEAQGHLKALERKDGPFAFVGYLGTFKKEDIITYLKNQDTFDVLAVFSHSDYDDVRLIVEEKYNGPKILLSSFGFGYNPPQGKYELQITIPIEPSKFEESIRAAFSKIINREG